MEFVGRRGEGHLDGGGGAGRHGDLGRVEGGLGVGVVEPRLEGVTVGAQSGRVGDLVGGLGVTVVGDGDGLGHGPLGGPQGELAGGERRGGQDGSGDVEHARALTVHVVQGVEVGVPPPALRVGRVLEDVAHLVRLQVGAGLQEEGDSAGDVRSGHGGAADGGVSALVHRVGGVDQTARGADVRLQVQVGGQAVGAEAADETAGRVGDGRLLAGPGEGDGVAGLQEFEEVRADLVGDADGEGAPVDDAAAGEHAGQVVVDHDTGGAGVDGGVVLLGEGAFAPHHQRGLAGGVAFEFVARGQTASADVDEFVALARGGRQGRVPHLHVGDGLTALGDLGGGGADVGVVVGGDPDDVGAQPGSPGRVQAAGALVADGGDHDHALVDEVVGGDGGRVLRPGVRRADAHVEHVHVVGQGLFHGGDHDVGGGGAGAAEDLVGAEDDVGGHTGDLPLGADDAGDVGAVAVAVLRVVVGGGGVGVRVPGVVVVADEVVAGHHALGGELSGAAEVRVGVVDPGVHDGDAEAFAGDAEFALDDVGAGHAQRGVHLGGAVVQVGDLVAHHGVDGGHAGDLPGGTHLGVVHFDGETVPQFVEGEALGVFESLFLRLGAEFGVLVLDSGRGGALGGGRALQFDEPQVLDLVGEFAVLRGGGRVQGGEPGLLVGARGRGHDQSGHECQPGEGGQA